jgi:hypothetical protein
MSEVSVGDSSMRSSRRIRVSSASVGVACVAVLLWSTYSGAIGKLPAEWIERTAVLLGILSTCAAMAFVSRLWKDVLLEIIVDIFVAVSFGILVIGLDGSFDLATEYAIAVAAGIAVFSVQALAHFSGAVEVVKRLRDEVGKSADRIDAEAATIRDIGHAMSIGFKDLLLRQNKHEEELASFGYSFQGRLADLGVTSERLAAWAAESHYAAIAADALNLKASTVAYYVPDGADKVESADLLAAGTRSHLGVLRAWLERGRSFKDPKASKAWLRLLQVYADEEVFDIGRGELATNVRNYAYLLLGLIEAFAESGEGSPERLVIVNCSPFALKDFFNFPNGRAGSRFYHEPEFYGTYRRALSEALRRNRSISAFRLVLASNWQQAVPADKWPKERIAGEGFSELGWPIDCLEKLILDTASYWFKSSAKRVVTEAGESPDGHLADPRVRLRHLRPGAIYWQPTIRSRFPAEVHHQVMKILRDAADMGVSERDMITLFHSWYGSDNHSRWAAEAEMEDVSAEDARGRLDRFGLELKDVSVSKWIEDLLSESTTALRRVELSHRIDSALAGKGRLTQLARSSTGVDLGPAEDFLHKYFAGKDAGSEEWKPLLDYFAQDLLGLDSAEKKSLLDRVRVVVVNRGSEQDVASTILRSGLSSEFLLVGTCPKDCDDSSAITEMQPVALLTAGISEPFHTCRIQVQFRGEERDGSSLDQLEAHAAFARDAWTSSRSDTEIFLDCVDSLKALIPDPPV